MKKLFGALIIALSFLFLFGCDTGNSGNGDNNNSGNGDKPNIENLVEFRYYDEFKNQTVYKAELKEKTGKNYTLTLSGPVDASKTVNVAFLYAKKPLTFTFRQYQDPVEIKQNGELFSFDYVVSSPLSICESDRDPQEISTFKTDSEEYTLDLCYAIK